MYTSRGHFQRRFKSLWYKGLNMGTLIAVGSAVAVTYSVYAIFMMSHDLGYDNMNEAHQYMM